MKIQIDINSDMGKCFGAWIIVDGVDDEIMSLIISCNIASDSMLATQILYTFHTTRNQK